MNTLTGQEEKRCFFTGCYIVFECLCYRQSYSMDLYMDIVWGCVGVGNYVFHH